MDVLLSAELMTFHSKAHTIAPRCVDGERKWAWWPSPAHNQVCWFCHLLYGIAVGHTVWTLVQTTYVTVFMVRNIHVYTNMKEQCLQFYPWVEQTNMINPIPSLYMLIFKQYLRYIGLEDQSWEHLVLVLFFKSMQFTVKVWYICLWKCMHNSVGCLPHHLHIQHWRHRI